MRISYDAVVSVATGTAIVIASAILGQGAWVDYHHFGDRPLETDLAGAVAASQSGRQWVSIHDAPWRCAEQRRVGHSYFPATSGGVEVVARYDHDVSCEEVTRAALEGVIEPIGSSDQQSVAAAGLGLPPGAPVRFLNVCRDCGRGNARLGIILCAAFIALGFLLYPIVVAARRLVARWTDTVQGALYAPAANEAQALRKLRLIGLGVLALGAGCFRLGQLAGGSEGDKLRGAGGLAILLGVAYLLFPGKMRELANRGRVH